VFGDQSSNVLRCRLQGDDFATSDVDEREHLVCDSVNIDVLAEGVVKRGTFEVGAQSARSAAVAGGHGVLTGVAISISRLLGPST